MKHKTSELEGALLDAAVALAEGWTCEDGWWRSPNITTVPAGVMCRGEMLPQWSKWWERGGPIIERERIGVWREESGDHWMAAFNVEVTQNCRADHQSFGPTPLISAMRAYVASRFGEEVEL